MKKIIFLTGAGMSVESGFRTFRDNDGLWEGYPVEQVATYEGQIANPTLANSFYNNLRKKLYAAKPNEGHRLTRGPKKGYDVTVITQNVDSLHEKAGPLKVIRLHGELTKVCSSKAPYDNRYTQELPKGSCEVVPGVLAEDGSLLRPFIVFFGKSIPMIEPATGVVAQADILVIIGMSLVVCPATGLMQYTRPRTPVYLIDPSDTSAHVSGRLAHIKKSASGDMKRLVKLL